ncbi:MAG: GHKL domain-containing protein [Cyclobacteriaceae bacterium]
MSKKVLLALSLTFVSMIVLAQDYQIRQINTGLSNGTVSALHEDRLGFVWIGTQNGLNKYDGKNTVQYVNVTDEFRESTRDFYVQDIREDSIGDLWLVTNGSGLCKYVRELNKIVEVIPNGEGFTSQHMYAIDMLNDSILAIGYQNGFSIYNAYQNKIIKSVLDYQYIQSVLFDDFGNLWAGGDRLVKMSYGWETFELIKLDENYLDDVVTMIAPSQGEIWIGTRQNGLFKLLMREGEIVSYHHHLASSDPNSISANTVMSLFKSEENVLWIGTENGGLNRFDLEKNKIVRWSYDPSGNGFNANSIWSLLQTSNGHIWAGAFNNGINIIQPNESKFDSYIANGTEWMPLGNNVSTFAQAPDGNYYIGFDGNGLNVYNPKTKKFKNINVINDARAIICMQQMGNDLYAGTWSDGLIKYNVISKKWTIYQNDGGKTSLISNNIFDLLPDRQDPENLWIASWDEGLIYMDTRANEFLHGSNLLLNDTVIKNEMIYSLGYDSENVLWVGGGYTLVKVRYDSAEGGYVGKEVLTNTELVGNDGLLISSILSDRKGRVWIGSNKGGLFVTENFGKDFVEINVSSGLANNYVQSMIEDDSGDIWITTTQGMSRMRIGDSIEQLEFWNFDQSDGLQGDLFHLGGSFKDEGGNIYVGGNNGFNVFNSDEIILNQREVPIYITDFKLFNKSLEITEGPYGLKKNINSTRKIILPHDQNIFTIDYIGINLAHSDKNQYAYKMEGVDKDWNYVGDLTSATYTTVDPGSYTFKVRAANEDGVWTQNEKSIQVIIEPPVWELAWFKAGSIAFILFLSVGFYKLRTRSIRQSHQQLERIVDKRTSDLKREIEVRKEAELELTKTLNTLKSTQDKLVQVEKISSLGTLTAGIAHELNNPLNFIAGGINLFNQSLTENNQLDEYNEPLSMLQSGFDRSAKIVKSLTALSNRDAIKREPILINELIDFSLLMLNDQYSDHVSFDLDLQLQDSCMVYAANLRQAITNILENGIQAVERDGGVGKIWVKTYRETDKSDFAVISIENTGAKIPEINLSKIYDPFFTTKSPGDGIGLGLSVAYALIEQHHGSLEAKNTNKGVIFIVKIPFVAPV